MINAQKKCRSIFLMLKLYFAHQGLGVRQSDTCLKLLNVILTLFVDVWICCQVAALIFFLQYGMHLYLFQNSSLNVDMNEFVQLKNILILFKFLNTFEYFPQYTTSCPKIKKTLLIWYFSAPKN